MPPRGRNIVYRVRCIPVGPEAHNAYHIASKELSSSAEPLARSYISSVVERSRPSGTPNDQAKELLRVAVKFKELQFTGADVAFGQMTVDIIPSCPKEDRTRAALVHFEDDHLPKFLGGSRTMAKREELVEFGGCGLMFDNEFKEMTQLYQPTAEVIKADIIAVPGLNGHAFGSWRARDTTGNMWLRDFFHRDFQDCRTFIYGNNTSFKDFNVSKLADYGKELFDEIKKIRQEDEERNRPLYLMGHSFGGLVIEKALCIDDYAEAEDKDIVVAVHGIMFFGVPHRGLNTDEMRMMLEKENPRKELLEEIKEHSPDLQRQVNEFKHIIQKHSIHVVSFYERQQTRGIQMIVKPTAASMGRAEYGRVSDNRYLSVDTNSAILGLNPLLESTVPSDADHSNIVKIPSTANKMYQDIKYHMRQLMKRKHLPAVREGYGIQKLMQLPGIQLQNAIETRDSGSPKAVMAYKPPRMPFGRLALLVDQMLKFCLVLFQKTSMLYLRRHSLHFEDLISRMREEYGNLESCQWILNKADCPEYAAWSEGKEPQFILIESGPGYGKSCLASFLSEREDTLQNVTLHFFSAQARQTSSGPTSAKNKIPVDKPSLNREPRKRDAGLSMHSSSSTSHKRNDGAVEEALILRSLLWQLADKLTGENQAKILRKIVDKRRKLKALPKGAQELFNSSHEMWDIIMSAPGVSEIRLIIDDVHYCDKKFIKNLTERLEKPTSSIVLKVILTTGSGGFKLDSDTLGSSLKSNFPQLHLAKSEGVKADVKKYLKKRLEDMSYEFSLEKEFTDPLEQQTLEKTGNFLWAKASMDKMQRVFNTWRNSGKEEPWVFTPDILPADDLDGVLSLLLNEVSPIGRQILKWEALTYDVARMGIQLQEEDFKQMFRYSDNYPDLNPEKVFIKKEVQPAAYIDDGDGNVKGFHPSLMDHVRKELIKDEDRRDLAVICLKYLCTNKEYVAASFELLNSGFFSEKSLTKLSSASSKVLGFNGNTRSRLLAHIMLFWPDHISILGDDCPNSSFERLQVFYEPGKRFFEAWHYYYRASVYCEYEPWINQYSTQWIYLPKKTSLLHIVANRGTLNLFKRCLPMTAQSRRTMGSTMEPRILFRWHENRVSNPRAPVLDYQDEKESSLLIAAIHNSTTSDIARYLIAQGADVDAPDYHKNNPLSHSVYASKNFQYEIMLSLMKRGVKEPDLADDDGDTPLMCAVMEGSSAEVVALLSSTGSVDVNHRNNYGESSLITAARSNNLAATKILLEHKDIDINHANDDGLSALLLAAACGYNDFIKLLLEQPKLNVDQVAVVYANYPKATCLGLAALYGNPATVELLLKDPRVNLNPTPDMIEKNHAFHALSFAAQFRHETVVPVFLRDPRTEIDFKGWKDITPLMSAARGGSVSIVSMLLCNEEVNIDAVDTDGLSPLTRAVQSGFEDVAQVLVDSNAKPEPQRLFKEAVLSYKGDTDGNVLRWVLDHYLDEIDIMVTDDDGRSALMWAAEAGKVFSVDILLNRCKLDPNTTSKDGQTALLEAAKKGHQKVIKALMEDDRLVLHHRDKDGRTALSYAASNGHADVVDWLLGGNKSRKLEKGNAGLQILPKVKMDPNTTGIKGSTAIIEAAKGGHTKVIEILQFHEEANFNHVDDEGRNALSYAAANGHDNVVKLLIEGRSVQTALKPTDFEKSDENKKDADEKTKEKTAVQKAETGEKSNAETTTKELDKVPNQNMHMMDPNFTDPKGRTPLIDGAQAGHEKVMQILLSHGKVNLSHQDNEGRTALYHAAENGHAGAVKLLLEGVLTAPISASVDAYSSTDKDYPYTVTCTTEDSRSWSLRRTYSDFQHLKHALLEEFKQEAGKAGQQRILPYMPCPVSELTESIVATKMQYLNSYIKALLKTPENVSKSLLVKKFFSPRPGDCETTPDKAARLSANNHKGPGRKTPLIEATRMEHLEVVRVLVEHESAALNHQDDEGRTALSYAVEKGSLALVRLLLEGGKTNKDARDKQGRTPVDYVDVKHEHSKDIVALLKEDTITKEAGKEVEKEKRNPEDQKEEKKDQEDEKQENSEKGQEEKKTDEKTENSDGESENTKGTGTYTCIRLPTSASKVFGASSYSDNEPETSKMQINPPSIDLSIPPNDTETPGLSVSPQRLATPEPNPDTIELMTGTSCPSSPTLSTPPTPVPASPEQALECHTCGKAFNSRTKLLIHFREAGHQQADEEAGKNNDWVVEATEILAG